MKRFLVLVSVLILIFALASCGSKKKDGSSGYEEQVSKEIKADEGGKVESSDGKTSVDIPAGALDEDTTITMTIYSAEGYEGTEGKKVISKVVNFEPNGTIFKKPVIITMAAGEKVEKKTIVAAVYDEKKEDWSYSQGFYVILDGKTEAGDPIMHTTDGKEVTVVDGNLTAAGDPIMMTNAAGDPIMTNAAGDPIMMSAAGDPIMMTTSGAMGVSAAGDPIMSSAAGDPIMMTTGHFTAYAFAVFDPREKENVEPDDNEPVEDDDEPVDDSDDIDTTDVEISDEDEDGDEDEDVDEEAVTDEDIVPEPPKVYSKVICTGQRDCGNGNGSIIMCPKEGEPFYGQDANYISRKSCVPQSFERLEKVMTAFEGDDAVIWLTKDNNTGLTWFYTEESGEFDKDFCENVDLDGNGWRLPTPKEFLTIADADIKTGSYAVSPLYFPEIGGDIWTSVEGYYFSAWDGSIAKNGEGQTAAPSRRYVCVKGEEYGKTNAFTEKKLSGEDVVFDETTNLMWQKGSTQVETLKDAFEHCEGLEYAGYTDWRLPNKNEFATLMDYSKTGDSAMSDFPGMEKAEFVVSTSFLLIGGDYDSMLWIVNTADGTFEIRDSWVGDYSVRCVRSDLDPFPADGITECDPKTGFAPCKDSSSGIIWSPRIVLAYDYTWQKAARECRDLDLNGGHKWRLPTIDELRTLVDEDPIRYGGDCEVSTECIDAELCSAGCETPTEEGFESRIGDYGILISGTVAYFDAYDHSWAIDTESGSLYASEWEGYSDFLKRTVVRCVWDDALNAEQTPYEGDGGLYWSSISTPLKWSDAALYCRDLEEGQYSDWRVPSFDELSQLANCNPKTDNCIPRTDGFYSPFYDAEELWTKNVVDQNFTFYDFMTLESESISGNDWTMVPVRCVRGGNVETQQFPQEGGPHLWSEISGEISSFGEAETYCNNIPQVAGYLPWEVPSENKLADIVNGDYCKGSGPNSLLANNTCGTFSLEGFSIFGDMVPLISRTQYGNSSQYYVVDFAKGEITLDNSSVYVRCVAEEQSN